MPLIGRGDNYAAGAHSVCNSAARLEPVVTRLKEPGFATLSDSSVVRPLQSRFAADHVRQG